MSWIGLGTAAVGVVGSALSKPKVNSLPNDTYNMYGQRNTPNTGGITSMNNLFGRMNSDAFQGAVGTASNNYVNSLNSAATDPGLGAAYRYALGGVKGQNLSNPMVTDYANQAYQSNINAGADQAARTRSMFARGGMGFSTGNQQAMQADAATAASKGALARSGILANNEQFERGMQQQDVGLLDQQIAQPSGFLGQINNALYSPLNSQAGLTTQLTGGNQVASPTYMANPTLNDTLAGGLSMGTGLYSAYRNIFGNKNQPGADTSGMDTSPNGSYNDMLAAMDKASGGG